MTLGFPFTTLVKDSDSDLRQFESLVQRFAETELNVTGAESLRYRREIFESAARLGLTGASTTVAYGGSELSHLAIAAMIHSLAQAQLGPAIWLSVHLMVSKLINQFASTKLHERLLTKLADGELLGAFALTEADAGSDAAALGTRAEENVDGYLLNGEKIYITSAGFADVYLVFARTGEPGKKGISAFVVESTCPGISFGKPEHKMGCEGSPIATVTFDACQVSREALLGTLHDGYRIALAGLAGGRVNIAAAACGLATSAVKRATDFAKHRKQFNQAIGDFQGIQFLLADAVMSLAAATTLTRSAAEELDDGAASNTTASAAKCVATDMAMKVTTDAVQIFGGAGYLADYHVERLMRDAKMLQIVEGTNQIQRVVIARAALAD